MKKASVFILPLIIFSVFIFNFSVFKSNATSPSDFGSSTLLTTFGLKEGDLISAIFSDDPDVYIINEHGYKRLFLNPEIFKFYSHLGGFANIKLVTPEIRDSFPTSGFFRNCEDNDQKVYGTSVEGEDSGRLHWINKSGDQAVQEDPEFFRKVFCINRKEFNWYPRGTEYKALKEVPQYHRAVPAIPAVPAMPAVPASLSHPFVPISSVSLPATPIIPTFGSLPLAPASASVPQTAPSAQSATPATPAQPVGSTPTPTPFPSYSTRPVVSSVTVSFITSNSAVISWITDVPATGFVNYGSTPTNWKVSPENTSYLTQHSFTISNLAVNTFYTFRVYSHNAYGDQTDIINGYPPNRTFTTLSGSVSCSSINLTLNDGKTTYVKGTDNLVNYTWTCSPVGSADVNIGIQKPTGWISLNTTANSSTKTSSINISGSDYPAGTYRLEACFGTCGSIVAGQTFTISSPSPTLTPTPTPTSFSGSWLKVVSPNGGEQWKNGEKHAVNASFQNLPGGSCSYVRFDLMKGGTLYKQLETELPGAPYNWTITNIELGNYKVRAVNSYVDNNCYGPIVYSGIEDYSDAEFTIVADTTPTPTPTGSALAPPQSVTASLGTSKVSVVWSGGITSKYKVYRCVASFGCGGALAYSLLSTLSDTYKYDDYSVTSGTVFRYKIYGCDSSGSSCSTTGTESNDITYSAPTPTPTPATASVSYDNFSRNMASVPKNTFSRDLAFGSTGNDVKQLQALLVNEVGYSADLITGYFGRITRDAVKRFQEKYGVKPVSGYFGEITRKALRALLSNQ